MISDEGNWSRFLAAAMFLHGVQLSEAALDESVYKTVASYFDDLRLLPEAWAVTMASEVLLKNASPMEEGAPYVAK